MSVLLFYKQVRIFELANTLFLDSLIAFLVHKYVKMQIQLIVLLEIYKKKLQQNYHFLNFKLILLNYLFTKFTKLINILLFPT